MQLFLEETKLPLELEKGSAKEKTKSAVYNTRIGLVLKCGKARPA